MIKKHVLQLPPATGEEGKATSSSVLSFNMSAHVWGVVLMYKGLPATTKVAISEGFTGAPVLTKAGSNTNTTFYPVVPASKAAEAGASTLEVPPIAESLNVELSEGDPGGVLTVLAYVETL